MPGVWGGKVWNQENQVRLHHFYRARTSDYDSYNADKITRESVKFMGTKSIK